MSDLARQLIASAKAYHSKRLDLGNCGLTSETIPDELFELTHLEELSFTNSYYDVEFDYDFVNNNKGEPNHLSYIPDKIVQLSSLKELDIRGNSWPSDGAKWSIRCLDILNSLSKLTKLNCSYNQITTINLPGLTGLRELICRSNQISQLDLPELPVLNHLDCSDNQLTELNLFGRPSLQTLYCSFNQITKLNLSGLPALYLLRCNYNQLTHLNLSGLPALHLLICRHNQLTQLSTADLPIKLRELYCNNNQLKELNLSGLTALEKIDCNCNQITQITLSELPALRILDCEENQLRIIPRSLLAHPTLWLLDIRKNPLQIPVDLLDNPYSALQKLRDYFVEIDKEGTSQIQYLKAILVGNGCVGKSTLLYQIKDGSFRYFSPEDRTHGVVIEEWKAAPNLIINWWDFAGQEVYHPTHRLFLSQRTLYVLVWATDKPCTQGEANPLSYWLDYIADLGNGSLVQVIQNLFEGQAPEDINELNKAELNVYRQQGIRIDNRGWVNAKTGARVGSLRNSIVEDGLELLRLYPQPEPLTWERVRQRLVKLQPTKKTISFSHFESICQKSKVNPSGVTTLLQHLHDTGQVYYYEGLFGNEIILQQDWVLEAVYAILKADSIKRHQGRLRWDDLSQIWHERYSENEQTLFVEFMIDCEILFERGSSKDLRNKEYLVPQLLAETVPDYIQELWKGQQHKLLLRLTYPFLHRSMLDRFLNRALTLCQDTNNVYRNGILFGDDYGNTAYVIFDKVSEQKLIFIACWGIDPAILLGRIRNEFDRIRSLERATQQISIDGKAWVIKEPTQRWEELLLGKTEYTNFTRAFSINDTLVKSSSADMKKKVFISYSRHDKVAYLDRLLNQLKALQNFGILIYWEDSQLIPGEKWDDRIQTELATADVIILLVSEHSLATDYIWNKEIQKAAQRAENKEAVLFPIILDHCSWELSPLADYVLLPTKAKPIKDHKDQGKVWKEVAMALAKRIKDIV